MIKLEGTMVKLREKHPNKLKRVKGQKPKKVDCVTMLG